MKMTKVISRKQLPSRFPLGSTIAVWLLLDRLHAPSWTYGVFWTLFGFFWIGCFILILVEDDVELKELK